MLLNSYCFKIAFRFDIITKNVLSLDIILPQFHIESSFLSFLSADEDIFSYAFSKVFLNHHLQTIPPVIQEINR